MSVLAVLLALLIEQARPSPSLGGVRDLYRQWQTFIGRNFDAGLARHAWVVWALTVLVPVVVVASVDRTVASFSVLLSLVLNVAVLYVTLGFRSFSHYFTGIREALDQGEEARARSLLAEWQRIDTRDLPRTELLRQVIEYAVLASHRQVFGVFFWYVLLATLGFGPAGALLYRLTQVSLRHWAARHPVDGEPVSPNVLSLAERLWQVIDWIPARLTATGFAIVGNFEEAVASWRRDAGLWASTNDGTVLAAAAGALGVQLGASVEQSAPASRSAATTATTPSDGNSLLALVDGPADAGGTAPPMPETLTVGAPPQLGHLQSVVGLVWRSVVLWMLLLALLSIANLLG
jgi:adenosylcobinamide-phosphate synthase